MGKNSVINAQTNNDGIYELDILLDKCIVHAEWIAQKKAKTKKFHLKKGDSLVLHFYL